jgi:hypothetical protein
MSDAAKPDLSGFQDDLEEELKPKTPRRKPDPNKLWSAVPNWIHCRMTEGKASGAAWACLVALCRLMRDQRDRNPVRFYGRVCAPGGATRGRALKDLERLEVIKLDATQRGMAPRALPVAAGERSKVKRFALPTFSFVKGYRFTSERVPFHKGKGSPLLIFFLI